jgi:sarcosine oxidase subunit delta
MLLIRCPYCEAERPELEFTYAGEAHVARPADPSTLTDAEWKNFLFIRSNARGTHFERWRHMHGCGRFFNAVRDTVSDQFAMTYKAGLPRPPRADRDQGSALMSTYRVSGGRVDAQSAGPLHGFDGESFEGFARATRSRRPARQRRSPRRPLVQISPPARLPLGRLGGAECAGRRRPRRWSGRAQYPRHRCWKSLMG